MTGKGKGRGRGRHEAKTRPFPAREEGQVYARVTKMLGDTRVTATGTDGQERTCKIAGRMRKREWVRVGDLVLVSLPAEVVFKYNDVEVRQLGRMGEQLHVPRGGDEDDPDADDLIRFEQNEAEGSDGGSIDLDGV